MGNIRFTNSLQVSKNVLDEINALLVDTDTSEFWIEVMSNCREQGFSIQSTKKQVNFCENRNSDDIAVYFGKNDSNDFVYTTNLPSDKVYRQAKYFSYDEVEKAARFIVWFLFE